MAVDIHIKELLLSDLLLYAQEMGFNGIGFYEKKNFLHLDIKPGLNTFGNELRFYFAKNQ